MERRSFLRGAGLAIAAMGAAPAARAAEGAPPPSAAADPTGYAAMALVGDASLVPLRGQTARLLPQPEVDYAVSYDTQNVCTVPRRDGIVVQEWSPNDYGNEKEAAYLEAARNSVAKIARLFEQMRVG